MSAVLGAPQSKGARYAGGAGAAALRFIGVDLDAQGVCVINPDGLLDAAIQAGCATPARFLAPSPATPSLAVQLLKLPVLAYLL